MGIFVAFIRKHFVQHKTKYFVICHTGSFRARKISFRFGNIIHANRLYTHFGVLKHF